LPQIKAKPDDIKSGYLYEHQKVLTNLTEKDLRGITDSLEEESQQTHPEYTIPLYAKPQVNPYQFPSSGGYPEATVQYATGIANDPAYIQQPIAASANYNFPRQKPKYQYAPPQENYQFPQQPYPMSEPQYKPQMKYYQQSRPVYVEQPQYTRAWQGFEGQPGPQFYQQPPPGIQRPIPQSRLYMPQQVYSTGGLNAGAVEYQPRAMPGIRPIQRNEFIEDFKQKMTYNKMLELTELKGHLVELSKDQFGSRYLQQKLQKCTLAEKDLIFSEIKDQAFNLMTDVFGNYVIQMLLQEGSRPHITALLELIKGKVRTLSLNMYGCRCVQKAIEAGTDKERALLLDEIKPSIVECVNDQNANHVLQRCIELLPAPDIGFLFDYFKSNAIAMSIHSFGCRIMQRIIERSKTVDVDSILDEVVKRALELSQDQYGNYVIQHILEFGKEIHKHAVFAVISSSLVGLSKQKYSSNVIEKCFHFGSDKDRMLMLTIIAGKPQDPNPPLYTMMKDKYANYVVQKAVEVAKSPIRETLIQRIMVCPDHNNYCIPSVK
jgi:hypothetical protein